MIRLAIADLYCGAGGTSQGAIEAGQLLKRLVKLTAVNHWEVAIATHSANHPGARHLCTGLDSVRPLDLYREGELDMLWASPECTHHSSARGGKPINDQSRATAWCVVRWAGDLRPPVILVENVPEFETWGPIGTNGRPLKSKRGATFHAWIAALESLGYTVDWRVLCAADYGDPTTRRRLFIQAVRGRRKIVWPDPTHAPLEDVDMFGTRKPYVSAREIIDWSLPGTSIYERKRPLSDKTMRRIMAGLEKFGLKPFTCSAGGPRVGPNSVEEPLGTVLCRDHRAVATPFLVKFRGTNTAADVDRPAPTVTASGTHLGLAQPFIVPQRSTAEARSIDKPAPTVTTTSRGVGLAEPFLVKVAGAEDRPARSTDRPMPTVTAGGIQHGLAQPFLIHTAHGGERQPGSIDQPTPTIAGNRGDLAVCEASLLPQHAGGVLRPVDRPVPTVATDGAIGLVEPYLVKYFGTGGAKSVDSPLDTVTAKPRFGLVRPVVEIQGERYLVDIRFRMLQPHELAAAQGFRPDYKFTGNKSDQVKQIGNAVPRRLARALCLAVLSQRSDVAEFLKTEGSA
jgi:DNA (cytosine-5)-methyltransferase 1